MGKDATIKVRLDTKPAQAELRSLGKEGQAAAERVSANVNKSDPTTGGLFGAGIGAGLGGRAKGVVKDIFARGIADAKALLLMKPLAVADAKLLGPEARGIREGANEVRDTFSYQVQQSGSTKDALQHFGNRLPYHTGLQKGANQIDQDIGQMLLDQGVKKIIEAVGENADKIIEKTRSTK